MPHDESQISSLFSQITLALSFTRWSLIYLLLPFLPPNHCVYSTKYLLISLIIQPVGNLPFPLHSFIMALRRIVGFWALALGTVSDATLVGKRAIQTQPIEIIVGSSTLYDTLTRYGT